MGQLLLMAPDARDEHESCIRCHAPLAEQADSLVAAIKAAALGKVLTKEEGLHAEGLICAGCHVREQQRFGPPRRDGSGPYKDVQLPHDGWQVSNAFSDSKFCASCHQFEADDYALNGKLLENTYAEWQASDYPKQGKQCQSCHMPDRRHLWRGIHDQEMTRQGVTVTTSDHAVDGDELSVMVNVANSGTGHHFPTYVTPQIYLEGVQLDRDGEEIVETLQQYPIGWGISLDLATEYYDTRIPAGEEVSVSYGFARHANAATLLIRLRVEPDAFYTGFYRAMLDSGMTGVGTGLIQQALDESLASHYLLYEERIALTGSYQLAHKQKEER
jgi:hypothetical protein